MRTLDFLKLWIQSMIKVAGNFKMDNKGFFDGMESRVIGVITTIVVIIVAIVAFNSTIFQAGDNSIGNFTKNIGTQATAVGGFSASITPVLIGLLFIGLILGIYKYLKA